MRTVLFAVLATLTLSTAPAQAAGGFSPNMTKCDATQARQVMSGNGVVLFHATWCPVCNDQAKVLDSFTPADGLNKEVKICVVDYDKEAELKKDLGVTRQSTFVRFDAGKETGRYLYKSDREEIRAFLQGS